jgi:hypothetical protein
MPFQNARQLQSFGKFTFSHAATYQLADHAHGPVPAGVRGCSTIGPPIGELRRPCRSHVAVSAPSVPATVAERRCVVAQGPAAGKVLSSCRALRPPAVW